MNDLAVHELSALLPEACLALGVMAILAADLLRPAPRALGAWIGTLACAGAFGAAVLATPARVADVLAIDAVAHLARPAIALATALILLAGRGEHGGEEDHGAWAVSVCGLGLGGLITASASHLVSLWLGLELMSLAGYVLAAWRPGDRRAAEAGMKYALFGGVASALMLFGMSHVYGTSGHLDFAGIGTALGGGAPPAVLVALCLAGAGIAFKLAVVPFHFYAPDVYQGAPALTVAAISVAPKIAATAALVRGIAMTVQPAWETPGYLGLALIGAAVASLVVASLTALVQRDAKRIVAFSGIGHAGTVLVALACLPGSGSVAAAAFYLGAYAVANTGALVCLAVLERERGSCSLAALAGAREQRPWLTAALCLFTFSLAGVPPLAGFLAKWGVLREALHIGLGPGGAPQLLWAALAVLVTTVISAWSYLLVVRAVVLAPSPAPLPARPRLQWSTVAVLVFCAATTIGAGFWLDGFATLARAVD